jgi:hypothetical protein
VLKHIFTALAFKAGPKEGEVPDLLSDQQFDHFASFINCLILKKMGYLSCSRLALCATNAHKVLDKLTNYHGLSCGLQLTL